MHDNSAWLLVLLRSKRAGARVAEEQYSYGLVVSKNDPPHIPPPITVIARDYHCCALPGLRFLVSALIKKQSGGGRWWCCGWWCCSSYTADDDYSILAYHYHDYFKQNLTSYPITRLRLFCLKMFKQFEHLWQGASAARVRRGARRTTRTTRQRSESRVLVVIC